MIIPDNTPFTLIFVYANDGGVFNTLIDIGHKIVSPQTYNCNLCAITYGVFTENKIWKDFIRGLSIPVHFFHRDDFFKKYPGRTETLPALFKLEEDTLSLSISADQINSMKTIDELISAVNLLLTKGPFK